MEELYRSKGGQEEFNCVDVHVSEDDLANLERTILDRELPETGGFFFGGDSYEDYEGEYGYKQHDLEFIKKAKEATKDGWRIVYSSWW
jgi:hypothetical protein